MLTAEVEDFAHPTMFAVLTSLVFRQVRRRWPVGGEPYGIAAAFAIVFAAISELAQLATGRDGSITDFVNDVAGASFALLCHGWFEGRRQGRSRARAAALLVVAGLLLAVIGYPLARILVFHACNNLGCGGQWWRPG